MEYGSDSRDILDKVLQEHKAKDTEFYRVISEFLQVGGWDAMTSAMVGPVFQQFPNILMPNGTLTQTFTSTAAANFVFAGASLIDSVVSNDYRFSLTLGSFNANNSPQIYIGVFDSPVASAGTTVPTFASMNGYAFYITTGPGSVQVASASYYNNGTPTTISGVSVVTSQLNAKEMNGKLQLFTGSTPYGSQIDMLPFYTTQQRFLHVYRCDVSAGAGNNFSITQTPWPLT